MSDEMDYLKLQNDFIVLQSEYDALKRLANQYKSERDLARNQLDKYKHAFEIISIACRFLRGKYDE